MTRGFSSLVAYAGSFVCIEHSVPIRETKQKSETKEYQITRNAIKWTQFDHKIRPIVHTSQTADQLQSFLLIMIGVT